jgi:hypothetical protein
MTEEEMRVINMRKGRVNRKTVCSESYGNMNPISSEYQPIVHFKTEE